MVGRTVNLGAAYDDNAGDNGRRALGKLDQITQLSVESATTTAQPVSPTVDQAYIIPTGKTGAAWASFSVGQLAIYRGTTFPELSASGYWEALTPNEGWRAWVRDTDKELIYNAAAWADSQETKLATARDAGQLQGFKNVLLNGSGRIAQRGAGPFTSASTWVNNDDSYLIDGVILLSDGADIVDVSQSTSVVPTGGYASWLFDIETASKKFGIVIPVEARDAAHMIAGNAVASFYARKGPSNATAETLRAAIISWQGTADTITSDVVSAWEAAGVNPTLAANWTYETTPQNLTLTTSFQRFDESEGLAGAIDTASTKQFALFIWLDDTDATVGDFIYITHWQLEPGLVATPFEHVPNALERVRAQRYFRTLGRELRGNWASSSQVNLATDWDMRATPTLTLLTTTPIVAEVGVANRTGTATAVVSSDLGARGGIVILNGFGSATAPNMAVGNTTDIVAVSAEL